MMKNSTYLIGMAVLLVAGVIFFVFGPSDHSPRLPATSDPSLPTPEGVQKIVLSMKDYNYYPSTITVKAGQPVSISLDSSITGCYRSFTIKGLGLAKNLPKPSDTLDFVPEQPGTYTFACSMGMGYGTLIVE